MGVLGRSVKTLEAIDYHCGGSPMRVITSGLPEIQGDSFQQRLDFVKSKMDYIRKVLCWEPRGYRCMTGVMPIAHDEEVADAGVVFLAATMYLPMCGEATICYVRWLLEHGIVKATEPETALTIQCPVGLVKVVAEWSNGKVGKVRFNSVPSYPLAPDLEIALSSGQKIKANVMHGGGNYAIVSQNQLGLEIEKADTQKMTAIANEITEKADKLISPEMCGTIITNDSVGQSKEGRTHFVVCGVSMVNRGFCGSGTTARTIFDHFFGDLKMGESRNYASVVTMQGTTATPIHSVKREGREDAVVIQIEGRAYCTGKHQFIMEADDPLVDGFLV